MHKRLLEPILGICDTLDENGFQIINEPAIPLRSKTWKNVNPKEQDFIFETHDVTINTSETAEQVEGTSVPVKVCITILHGTTENGETVTVEFEHYKPYFYLSMPEDADDIWIEKLMTKLRELSVTDPDAYKLNFDEVVETKLVHKHPTVGFRNGIPMPFVLFRFHNIKAYRSFRKALSELYPAPTRKEIESGIYRNEVMLCEAYADEAMKFYDWYDIVSCGWVKLPKNSYWFMDEGKCVTNHAFRANELIPQNDKVIANCVVDSLDVETVRDAEDLEMPDPTKTKDVTASIAHTIRDAHGKLEPFYIAWTWGNKTVTIPKLDRKGVELPPLPITVKVFKTEKDMLVAWSHWWVNKVQSDVSIGWNILCYDLHWLMTRLKTIRGISEYSRVWGKLKNWETTIKESKIESKAIAYKQYRRTPSPGKPFVDLQVIYERDTMLKLHNYKLETVAQHFLKKGKEDVHFSEIKHLFYGTLEPREGERKLTPEEQRGLLIYYNVMDTKLVMDLFFLSAIWPTVINICRVNRILPELLCPRGQQIRVYGGMHYVAHKNNYVVYRPHYHPLLDSPIFEDCETDDIVTDGKYQKDGDLDALTEYWGKVFEERDLKPKFQVVTINEKGEKKEEEMEGITSDRKNKLKDQNENKRKISENWTTLSKQPIAKKKKVTSGSIGRVEISDLDKLLKSGNGRSRDKVYLGGPTGLLSKNPKVKKEDKNAKAFSGGKVMEPKRGIYDNMPILDFNSLYPNLMISYKLDPALMVLDQRFATCPGVKYNRVVFSDKSQFLFAVSKNDKPFPGIMIQHTSNLIVSRKEAQAEEELYSLLQEMCIFQISSLINKESYYIEDLYSKFNGRAIPPNYTLPLLIIDSLCLIWSILFFRKMENDTQIFEALYEKAKGGRLDLKMLELFKNYITYNEVDYSIHITNLIQLLHGKDTRWMNSFLAVVKDYVLFGLKEDLSSCTKKAEHVLKTTQSKSLCELLRMILGFKFDFNQKFVNFKSRQTQNKATANSSFGFLGTGGKITYEEPNITRAPEQCKLTRQGMMSVVPVSACVTYLGRISIEKSDKYVADRYGAETVYTDTDSLFINFKLKGQEGFKQSFILGKEAAEGISDLFKFPGSTMKIVHEKTARRIILYDPKCYVLDKYLSETDAGKLEIKGLSLEKRDCSGFVSRVGKQALKYMVREQNVEAAKKFVRDSANDLVKNPDKYIDELAIWKKLGKKDYADNAAGHVELARKIKERTPCRAPRTGESVKYLYIDVDDLDRKKKMKDKIEDFDWVKEHKIPIDIYWYLTQQLAKTVTKIFKPVMTDPASLLKEAIVEQKRKQMKISYDITQKMRQIK